MASQLGLYETLGGEQKAITRPERVNPMVRSCGKGPDGARCKTCAHFIRKHYGKTFFKCEFRGNTNGPGTDHRANWPACSKYQKETT